LGVVLAGPDTARIAANGCREYVRTGLSNSDLAIVRDAMFEGTAKGVFALQLHGLEHFWPPSLMKVATSNEFAARWLTGPALPQTEDLPAHLQSRWIDASALPSQALSPDDIAAAVHQEIQAFSETFGHPAEVVVPPTFVWNMEVEHAWIRHGIRCVVTPGCRYEHRGVDGKLVRGQPLFHNGERGPDGLRYVVRNDYFEPQLGHSSADALLSVDRSTRLGRPTLFETHRFNFLGMNGEAAMRELESLVRHVLEKYPEVVFLSTRELAACYATSSDLLETRLARRLHCIIERLREQSRLYKLAWLTGIVLPAWMLWRFTAVRQT
ncbi:MAG TPA: hypothetical protein VFB54_04215, partial [Burkholderiales bacterium]|nr:hypothetical protein [Burkholderiales bacterium]